MTVKRRHLISVLSVGCLQSCAGSNVTSTFAGLAAVASDQPLTLEAWVTVQGQATGPLETDMTLHSQDRIQVMVRTSTSARLHLLYCDARAALTIFPKSEAIAVDADRLTTLPREGARLQLDNNPGHEVLYIVAFRGPLLNTDAQLQAALTRVRTKPGSVECGGQLETTLAGPAATSQPAAPLAEASETPSAPSARRHGRAARPRIALRGIQIVESPDTAQRVSAADDGIVVLRYLFRHVP